jgi:hypothetical protein
VTGEPVRHAETAAEAVRALNHATLPAARGLTEPADAYAVVGSLAVMTGRLPQALAQLQAFVEAEVAAGRVAIVAGAHAGDPEAAAAAVARGVRTASAATEVLRDVLHQVHETLAWAAAAYPDPTAGRSRPAAG